MPLQRPKYRQVPHLGAVKIPALRSKYFYLQNWLLIILEYAPLSLVVGKGRALVQRAPRKSIPTTPLTLSTAQKAAIAKWWETTHSCRNLWVTSGPDLYNKILDKSQWMTLYLHSKLKTTGIDSFHSNRCSPQMARTTSWGKLRPVNWASTHSAPFLDFSTASNCNNIPMYD